MFALRSLKFLVFASFIAAVSASPAFRDLVVHEQRQSAPNGFTAKGPAPADQILNLRIALVQGDMGGLEKALYDVSIPDSPLYGQHLTKEKVYHLYLLYLVLLL